MRDLAEIVAVAAKRRGGIGALEEALAATRSLAAADIAATPDHRILSAMTRRVFSAGFSSKVIEAKWDAFEDAFGGFNPAGCASMSEERLDALLQDSRIVRNGAKIASVQANGRFLMDLAAEHGSAARFFAGCPTRITSACWTL